MNKMKYSIFIFLLAVVGFSCSEDDVKELLTTEQTFTASETFDVSIGEDDPLAYSASKTVDASLSGVDITEVEILSITGSISNVVAPNPVNLTAASIVLEGTGVQLDIPATELSNGAGFDLSFGTIPSSVIDTIEAKLLADGELTITASATVDDAPIDFRLTISIEIKATGTLG